MSRRLVHAILVIGACALTGAALAGDQAPDLDKPPTVPRSFYQRFLVPRMTSGLDGDINAASVYVAANPWTRDVHTLGRIENSAMDATKDAVKQYVLQELQMTNWSINVHGINTNGGSTSGVSSLDGAPAERTAPRVRFGISHMTPRADVLIPAAHGNVTFSADVRGRLSTSFTSHASNFSMGVSLDPTDRSGSFSLVRRF